MATVERKRPKWLMIVLVIVAALIALRVVTDLTIGRRPQAQTTTSAANSAPTTTPSPTMTPSPPPTKTCDEWQDQANRLAELGSKTPLNNTISRASDAGCDITRPKLQPAKNWYPKGYNVRPDGELAFKFVRSNPDCYSCSAAAVNVVSKNGCPGGIYAEANVLDSAGTVIDWTNDSVPSLAPGQKARLNFTTYQDNADTIQIVDMTCNAF